MATLMLEGAVDDRDTIIAGLREQLRQAREDLAHERQKGKTVDAGVVNLRRVLSPLYGALQQVFGEIESMEVVEHGGDPPKIESRKSAVWESWKQKLGGKQAEFITALLTHGEMTAVQLKIATKCGQQTVYDTIFKLNKAGLINKNSGRFSLKEI
jgi:hypothetical protein